MKLSLRHLFIITMMAFFAVSCGKNQVSSTKKSSFSLQALQSNGIYFYGDASSRVIVACEGLSSSNGTRIKGLQELRSNAKTGDMNATYTIGSRKLASWEMDSLLNKAIMALQVANPSSHDCPRQELSSI